MAAALRVLCISGPNLQLLGTREPEVYGRATLAETHARLAARGKQLGAEIDARQTNHEGTIEFRATMRQHGVKHAFQQRDAAFGNQFVSIRGPDPD